MFQQHRVSFHDGRKFRRGARHGAITHRLLLLLLLGQRHLGSVYIEGDILHGPPGRSDVDRQVARTAVGWDERPRKTLCPAQSTVDKSRVFTGARERAVRL